MGYPPKKSELIPWHTLCIDLSIGPYKSGYKKNKVVLHTMHMINPATRWFEIVEVSNRRADEISNALEHVWLLRYP